MRKWLKNIIREWLKNIIREALADFFASEAGDNLLGQIMLNVLRFQLNGYELKLQKKNPDGTVENYTELGDPLAFLCNYFPNIEGAIRGAQSDAAQARNRAGQARVAVGQMMMQINNLQRPLDAADLVDITPPAGTLSGGAQAQIEE